MKLLWGLIPLLLAVGCYGQTLTTRGVFTPVNITARDVGSSTTTGANGQSIISGTPTAGSYAVYNIGNYAGIRVEAKGTWTGTLQAECTLDSATWFTVPLFQDPLTSSVTYTANFSGVGNVNGCAKFRIRSTAVMTGTATINAGINLYVGAKNGTGGGAALTNIGTGAELYTNGNIRSITASGCLVVVENTNEVDVALDSACAPIYSTGAGAPSAACLAGREIYTDTTNNHLYWCRATDTWARILSTNSTTVTDLNAPAFCSDAGANDTYACNLSPAIAAYSTGTRYRFKANTANTGAATINLNSIGAVTIKKVAGGVTTDLANNDIRANQWVEVVYDGTNMQMMSAGGNSASGGGLADPGANGPITRTALDTTAPASATEMSSPTFCSDAGANDTYACSLSPVPSAYVTGTRYRFKANTANTGAATVNFNSLGATTIKKVIGGITTDLSDNDIRSGQWVELVYDGTNMQMVSPIANSAASGGVARQMLISATGGGLTLSTGQTTYHSISGISTSFSTEGNRRYKAGMAGDMKDLCVTISTTQNAGGSLVANFRINGAGSALTLTIAAGSTANTYCTTTESATIAKNDYIALEFVNNFAGTSATITAVSMAIY